MSSVDAQRTKIEDLPVEIFLEIFAFFSLEEIITSFFDLNSCINSIIRSVKAGNHVINNNDAKAVELLNLFPTQIGRLFITRGVTIDFTSLINLRSLTIEYSTLAQLNGIRPKHFPILEILHIRNVRGDALLDQRNSTDDLFQVILSNGFPRLRVCTAVGTRYIGSSDKWTQSPVLRHLVLGVQLPYIYEQIVAVCPNVHSFKRCLDSQIVLAIELPLRRRLLAECRKLRELEAEKKFILDFCTFANSDSLSWNFNNERFRLHSSNANAPIILGRILPEKEPYCFAAFLIEFKFPPEYPFKPPEVTILDPIYHPNFNRDRGERCYCEYCGPYKPTMSVYDLIKKIIHTIDNPDLNDDCCQIDIVDEYRNNYDKFYETALQYTIKYGRPRQ